MFCSLGDGATSEGEFWESLNTASQKRLPVVYPDRGQRLRDLGACGGTDAGRRHLAPRGAFPAPQGPARGRLRLHRQPHCPAGRRPVGTRAAGPGAGPRAGSHGPTRIRCPTTSAYTRRPRSGPTRRGAIRWCGCARCWWPRAWQRRMTSRPSWPTSTARLPRRPLRPWRREARPAHGRRLGVLARRRSNLARFRCAGRAAGQARHDGERHQRHAHATRWRTTPASSYSARTWPIAAARMRWRKCRAKAACSR